MNSSSDVSRNGRDAKSGEGRREDRRSRYTRSAIKGAFFELLAEKGFAHLTVTDLCRRADVNRGTFYLHYVDKYALLDEVIDDALDVESPLDDAEAVPMCQRAPRSTEYRMLYTQPDVAERLTQRVIERGRDAAVESIRARTGLSEEDAYALFVYTANGNIAINRLMGWERSARFEHVQRLLRAYCEGGYEALARA